MDFAHSRAERYLAEAALQSFVPDGPLPPGFDRDAIARYRRIAIEAALEIYTGLRLVSAAEAGDWRRLVVTAPGSARPAPPQESSARATQLLDEMIEQVPRISEDEPIDTDALMAGPYGRFMAALTAAGVIGEFGTSETASWQERLIDRMLRARCEEVQQLRRRRSLELAELDRVVPGPATRPSGLTLVSAELYRDAVLLCWQLPYEPYERAEGEPSCIPDPPEAVVEDKIGTDYMAWVGGGGTGIGATWNGTTIVSPSPPRHARILIVQLGDDRFEIDLQRQAGSSAIR